jgi:hypothetical protein
MSEYNWNRIALTGFAGAGKLEAGKALEPLGYQDVSLGNIGKGDLDAIIQKRFGFSAFTEDRAQKKLIRNTLEWYMLDAFEFLLTEFFATMPEKCVATRVLTVAEATRWRADGHPLIDILKPGVFAVSKFEQEMGEQPLVRNVIHDSSKWTPWGGVKIHPSYPRQKIKFFHEYLAEQKVKEEKALPIYTMHLTGYWTEEKETTVNEPKILTAKEAREITAIQKASRFKDEQFAEHIKKIDDAIRIAAREEHIHTLVTLENVNLGRVTNFLTKGKGYRVTVVDNHITVGLNQALRKDARLHISWEAEKAG